MKLARTVPGWQVALPVDISLAIGVIGVAIATLLPYFGVFVTKARLTEPLAQGTNLRIDLMERMALTGEGLQTNVVAALKSDVADDVEKELGKKSTGISTQERGAAANRSGDEMTEGRMIPGLKVGQTSQENLNQYAKFSVDTIDAAIVVRGTLGESGRPFHFTLAPSVVAEGAPGSMLWLCGNKRPPSGWVRLAQGSTDLPADLQFSVCRDAASH